MGDPVFFGVLRVGSRYVAVRSDVLREAIAWPAGLGRSVAGGGHALGTFNLRGQLIPTADLRVLLGVEGLDAGGKIVVLHTSVGVIGLAVDDIAGLIRTSDAVLQQCHDQGASRGRPLISAMMLDPGSDRIIHVLDPDALGVDAVADVTVNLGGDDVSRSRVGFLVFACGGMRFCLRATAVHEIVDPPELDTATLRLNGYTGIAWRNGQAVPVVDLLDILGLPGQPAANAKLLVLDVGGKRVGMLISDVIAITHRSPLEVLPFLGAGLPRPEMLGGVLPGEDGGSDAVVLRNDAILLAHDAILQDQEVSALRRLHSGLSPAGRAAGDGADDARRTSFLAFEAGQTFLAPLHDVSEIIGLPADHLRIGQADGMFLGFLKSRHEMIPLVRGRILLGEPDVAPVPGQPVLVIRTGGPAFGLVVDHASTIEHLAVIEDMGHGRNGTSGTASLCRSLMIRTATGRTMVSVLDLAALGRLVNPESAAA